LANRTFSSLDELEEVIFHRCQTLLERPDWIRGYAKYYWWPEDAKSRYQRELYNYNLNLTKAQASQRQREMDVLRLREKLDNLNQQISELSVIRSPYAGRVRRVKIINQNNLTITAEVTLLVKSSEN